MSQVFEDIKELDLNISLEELKNMKKGKLKVILNRATPNKSLEELNKKKINHSKGKELKYIDLEMQRYFKPSHTGCPKKNETEFLLNISATKYQIFKQFLSPEN